jgi:hypothetical protein
MQQFEPNPKQLKLLEAMLDIEISPTISDTCSVAGIDRSTYYRWMNDDSFKTWFNSEWKKQLLGLEPILDKICLSKAQKDYKYLKLIQEKYFITRKEENCFTLNVDKQYEKATVLLDELLGLKENEQ